MLFSIYKEAFTEYRKNFKYFVIPMLLLIGSSIFHVYGLPALSYLSQPFQFILSKISTAVNSLITVPIIIIAALSQKKIIINFKLIQSYFITLWWRFLILDFIFMIMEGLLSIFEDFFSISSNPLIILIHTLFVLSLSFFLFIEEVEMIVSQYSIVQAFHNLRNKFQHKLFRLIGSTIKLMFWILLCMFILILFFSNPLNGLSKINLKVFYLCVTFIITPYIMILLAKNFCMYRDI